MSKQTGLRPDDKAREGTVAVIPFLGYGTYAGTVVNCVRNSLAKLGPSAGLAIEYMLETQYMLPLARIPREPERLVLALRELFGISSVVIEKGILDELCQARVHGRGSDDLDTFINVLEAYSKKEA